MVPERSVSGATCLNFREAVGDDGGTGAELAERHFPNFQIREAVGDDGGTERSLRSDTFPNFRHRVVGGVSGGTQERSDCNDSCSDYDTCLIAISTFLNKKDLRLLLFLLGAVSACPIQFG